MIIKVLGASGSEVPGHYCPAFTVDGKILLDAGTICISLNITEESNIRYILLTHAHFDHIKGISPKPFFLDIPKVIILGKFAVLIKGDDNAESPVQRGADHVCPEAGGVGEAGWGSLPAARGERAILLPLEA